MRWPLRNQILFPVLALLFATVGILSGLNFFLVSGLHQQRVEQNLKEVAQFLNGASFPLEPWVLQGMKSLSGADFLLVSPNQEVLATTMATPPSREVVRQLLEWSQKNEEFWDEPGIGPAVQIGQATYYYRPTPTADEKTGRSRGSLHMLLPEDSFRELWWRSVWPSMLVGLIALPIVAVFAAGLAAIVTRPLGRLRHQVEQAAAGNWEPLPPGHRNDEIRDLSEAVNQMTQQLKAYEAEVRKKERLETLVDLGSGIAHHLRNSATGCRMAIQLSQMTPQLPTDTEENLRVALRQLSLMDKYIQRFLSLDARSPSGRSEGPVDWVQVCRDVLDLLRPSAKHLGVNLEEKLPSEIARVSVPLDDLEQVLMNLVTNAMDAAAEASSSAIDGKKPKVFVDFDIHNTYGILRVWDTGQGPPDEIQDSLFDSFVTRKRNGVGLGLYLTHQIVQRHGGQVHWQRTADPVGTCFEVRLPLHQDSASAS